MKNLLSLALNPNALGPHDTTIIRELDDETQIHISYPHHYNHSTQIKRHNPLDDLSDSDEDDDDEVCKV